MPSNVEDHPYREFERAGWARAGRLGFTVWAAIDEHMIQKVVVDAVRETGNPAAALPVSPAGEISDIGTCVRLLREAGFSSPAPRAEKLESRASIESARPLLDLLTDGTVRMSAVIRSQPADKAAARPSRRSSPQSNAIKMTVYSRFRRQPYWLWASRRSRRQLFIGARRLALRVGFSRRISGSM